MASRSFYYFLVKDHVDWDHVDWDHHDWDHHDWDNEKLEAVRQVLENCDLQILIVKVGPGDLKIQLVKQKF